ncbi:MAG: SycD/LcrH family type III secretion system chaperone [Candidatus Competibacteraceae bacterium]
MADPVEASTDLADLLSAEGLAEVADFSQLVVNFLMNGKTIGELKGLTSEDMDAVYNVAYNAYASENYEEAHKIFKFLCYFDHLEKKHWLGLGVCRQMLKLYEQAIEAYTYAMLLDSNDPQPPLLAADCHIALGNRDAAISGLTAALEWSGDRSEYQSIRERATALLEVLNASASAAESEA